MRIKHLLFTGVILTINLFSQGVDSILVGTYLNSSDNPNLTRYNFSVVKPLGFNTIIQRAIVPINGIQSSNFDSLKQFPNLIGGNDSVPVNAVYPENIDWVYYFSNALYSKWLPGVNTIPELLPTIGLKKQFGSYFNSTATTGIDTTNIGKVFIDGPNYSQYQKYVYTNKYNPNEPITYKVDFRLKKGQVIGSGSNICSLQVVKTTPTDTVILKGALLTKEMLADEFTSFIISYNYTTPQNSPLGRGDRMLPPTTIPPLEEVYDSFYDNNTKIQFRIVWLGNAELLLDYIEVYDQEIWQRYFIDQPAERDLFISNYLSQFMELQPNMKYFVTMDEPHSFDNYHPIKTVQHLLDSLNSPVKLLTHFYPGWNNQRKSDNTLKSWKVAAKPARLMYWYFPYWVNHSSDEGLADYGYTLEKAAELDTNFYATVQTWGYKLSDSSYKDYRSPTPAEVSAQTLYALSFGAKGIFYEPFYTYLSWVVIADSGQNAFVEAIVDHSLQPRDIYYKVKSLNERIRGNLGKQLVRMKHTGYLRISNNGYGSNTPANESLELIPASANYNFHAGMFSDQSYPECKHFLLLNLKIDSAQNARTLIKKPDNIRNLRYLSIDPPGLLDTTLIANDTITINLNAGEGALLALKPALLWGGSLRTSDTVKVSCELSDNLAVSGGSKLVIKSEVNYSVKDTIEFKDSSMLICNGYIILDSNGAVVQNNWSNALIRSKNGGHPLLIWSRNTTMSGLSNYRVYRKNGNSNWQLLGSTVNCQYLDTAITILVPGQQSGTEEYYKVVPVNQRGVEGSSTNEIMYEIVGDLIEKKGNVAGKVYQFRLDQNYPNPFNPVTKINFELPSEGRVLVELFDIMGKRVEEILNAEMSSGPHSIVLNGTKLSTGVYFVKLKFGKYTAIKKMILLK